MSSDDFLTRYFQQLGLVIARLMGLRENAKHQKALDEIDQVLDTWFNIESSKIEAYSHDELIALLFNQSDIKFEKVKSIAELLYQKAVTYNEMGKITEASAIALTTLVLFRTIDQKSQIFSIEVQQRIAELDEMVAETKIG